MFCFVARLRTLGFETYQQYLKCEHWISFRNGMLGRRCYVCSTRKNLELHHCNYENLGEELPCDVVTLCERCHENVHKYCKSKKCNLSHAHELYKSYYWKSKNKAQRTKWRTNWRQLVNKSKKQTVTELQIFLQRCGLLDGVRATPKAYREGYARDRNGQTHWKVGKYLKLVSMVD